MKHEFQRFVANFAAVMLALCLCLTCGACSFSSSQGTYASRTYLMMDTVIEIKLRCNAETARPILDACGEIMTEVEAALSKTVETSIVGRFHEAGEVTFDAEIADLLALALEVSAKTDGAFDPTVGGLVTLWNVCGEADRLPTEAELAEALAHVGAGNLRLTEDHTLSRLDPQTTLDLGAVGKGYAIDLVRDYLESTDIPGGVISFGGNIAVFGAKEGGAPYRIGLRDPKNTAGVLGYLTLSSSVISVSGDYERYVTIGGERYHHILDPETGYPAKNGLHSVAVICENGALADALSTALFVMGLEDAMAFYRAGVYEFEAIFVTDGEILLTDGLAAAGSFEVSAAGYTVVTP